MITNVEPNSPIGIFGGTDLLLVAERVTPFSVFAIRSNARVI